MPRLQPVSLADADPITRRALKAAEKRVGKVPDSFAVTAHHRTLMIAQGAFELGLERARDLDTKLEELAVLKTAMVVGCEFCCDIGSFLARSHGVPEEQLRELPTFRDSDRFSGLEKLVLEYAVAMTHTPQETTDEMVAALREHLTDRQLVELTTAIAWENHRARFNAAMGLGAQGFSEGAFCVRPEAAAAVA